MPGEVVLHARFLEAQERHRTADRAIAALAGAGAGPGDPATIDGERVDATAVPVTEPPPSTLAAIAKPPRLGPVARWRVRRPSRDR
jgi:hypothetical protein